MDHVRAEGWGQAEEGAKWGGQPETRPMPIGEGGGLLGGEEATRAMWSMLSGDQQAKLMEKMSRS